MVAKRTLMYLYKMKSEGGLAVKEALGVQQIKHEGSQFKGDKDTVVINWGCGNHLGAEVHKCKIINQPESIYDAIKKSTFLELASRACRTIPHTTSRREAQEWSKAGQVVYCRLQNEGYEGQGIVIHKEGQVPRAPLYTMAKLAEREYRVHVVDGRAIAVHRKVSTRDDADPYVKNTANGWVFKRVSLYTQDVIEQAIPAVKAVGLDFAAVDVLWDGRQAWVLEANTAPGIDGMDWTVARYAGALKALAERL